MFKLKNLPLTISIIVVVSLIVGWGINMVLAWTDPTAAPPSGNVAAPINVSSTAQHKTGRAGFSTSGYDPNYGLTVGNNATYGIKSDKTSWFGSNISIVGDITAVDEICLDNGCRSVWPSGDGGDGNNYTTDISFSGTTTKTLTLSRDGLAKLTATFTDIDTDTNNYPTAISFSGNTTKTLTLTRSGLATLTATFTDNTGITAEADTLDTVCDRGNTTDQTIRTSGGVAADGEIRTGGGAAKMTSAGVIQGADLILSDDATVGDKLTISGDLKADSNSWGSCYWESYGYAAGQVKCNNGYYIAGINVKNPWLITAIYCCKL